MPCAKTPSVQPFRIANNDSETYTRQTVPGWCTLLNSTSIVQIKIAKDIRLII